MKRIYAFIIGLCVTTVMTSNVIKLNGGLDFVTSKMYLPDNLYYGGQVVAHSWRPGVSVSADYVNTVPCSPYCADEECTLPYSCERGKLKCTI